MTFSAKKFKEELKKDKITSITEESLLNQDSAA
jgi:hypothetical protein